MARTIPPLPHLPIDDVLPELRAALAIRSSAVLQAPPGAGKTTRVPLALLEESWLASQRIVMLEPRRLAARAAARRMADSLGEPVGATVGFRVRGETRVGKRTRVEVVTEGVLTRMLHEDPALDGVGLVIFDEFHERNLNADVGLALSLETQSVLRPEVRLLVTTGFLGGLTTFSTFSAEVTELLVRREWLWSAVTIGLHVVGSVALTIVGLLLARMLFAWGSS